MSRPCALHVTVAQLVICFVLVPMVAGPAPALDIYDQEGRRVRTLLSDEVQSAGPRAVWWDGRVARGRPMASGSYLYRFRSEELVTTKRMILLK